MDFSKKIVFFFLLITIYFHISSGTTTDYKVGDSNGWTNSGVNYTSWASSKSFNAGDVIWFEYNKQYHNVVRVTHKHYKSCTSSDPIGQIYNSGNDSITLKNPGHYYFICGFNNHCQDGQKVFIRVVGDEVQLPATGPTTSPSHPATYVHAPAPAPANSTSGGLRYMGNIGLVIWVLASMFLVIVL